MIFKALSLVVYYIIDNYVCADYVGCTKAKLHVANKIFGNTTYNDISGIGITGLLMNIISWNGFVKDTNLVVIFSCHIKLVPYYISKGFVLHEKSKCLEQYSFRCETNN